MKWKRRGQKYSLRDENGEEVAYLLRAACKGIPIYAWHASCNAWHPSYNRCKGWEYLLRYAKAHCEAAVRGARR